MNWPGHLSTSSISVDEAIPAGARYGAHTARALRNFAVTGPALSDHPRLVHAVVQVKIAAARANAGLGTLDPVVAGAIADAGAEVLAGRHLEQFVLPVLQGGGGTSTNMNVNEVLAALATQALADRKISVHPNDHVNRGQSTNDVMPTAIGLAVHGLAGAAADGLAALARSLAGKAAEYPRLEHLGRTCLQDAVPLPVREVHQAQAYGVTRAAEDLVSVAKRLLAVPLGATAVGTGIGAADGFAERAVRQLAELTGQPVHAAANRYHALSTVEPLVAVTDAMSGAGRVLARVATDLRLLASGPHAGIGEVALPAVQPGSSIMPGKVNPVIPELVMQVAFQLAGAATTAHLAAAAGELEVSAMAPVVTLGLLSGLRNLDEVARIFATACVDGLRWREDVVAANLAGSLADAVTAAGEHGYEHAARTVLANSPDGARPAPRS